MALHLTVQQWLEVGHDDVFPPFPADGDITCGTVRYHADADEFRIFTRSGFPSYDFAAERILTGAAFSDWLWQLHHTEWFTGQHAKDLLDCLCCYIYREHNGQFPQAFYQVEGGMMRGPDAV
jgi:hypothetical protein